MMDTFDQNKVTAAFESWLLLNETERVSLDSQIRGYLIRAYEAAPAEKRKPGRPKGTVKRKVSQIPATQEVQ